jgi:hypothetical protein
VGHVLHCGVQHFAKPGTEAELDPPPNFNGQWADDADYRQESASLGIRMGVNFAVYAMAH